MNTIAKGALAGLGATVVLSIIMVMKDAMGLMPELNVIAMLASMMGGSVILAWIAHFMIGVIWGVLFALIWPSAAAEGAWWKGAVFLVAPWLLMMVAVMPMAGAGVFGMNLGMMAPIMTLILHLIFGAVMGGIFAALVRRPSSTAAV